MSSNFEPMCTYEKCLSCELLSCWTGQIAREEGREAYDRFMIDMDFIERMNDLEDYRMDNTGTVDVSVRIPVELYEGLVNMASIHKIDLNAELVSLFECYVEAFKLIFSDPAAKALLGFGKY